MVFELIPVILEVQGPEMYYLELITYDQKTIDELMRIENDKTNDRN